MSAHEQRLYFLLQTVAHRLQTRADSAMRTAAGLSTAQTAVLTIVASEKGVSQSFVAEQLGQRESAVQTMVERLLTAGYVSRNRSPADGRAWELRATPKGRAALKKLSKPFGEINTLLDKSMSSSDGKRLAKLLQSILDTLDDSR